MIATAQGIIMNKNANLLSCNGGGINLTTDWAKLLMTRMGFVKRKACSSGCNSISATKRRVFIGDQNIVSMDEIPAELVINFDQTALSYVPASHWTLGREGTKRVKIIAKDDKRQLTAVFAGSSSGDFLLPQLIYEGKTDCCLPQIQFPSKWNVTKSENHWSNESTMIEYINKIILPYINEKRRDLKLSNEQPALLIFDNFKA